MRNAILRNHLKPESLQTSFVESGFGDFVERDVKPVTNGKPLDLTK